MNNEQQELLNEAYRKYADSHQYFVNGWLHVIPMLHSNETFINECIIDTGFSEKWGLKIEERELTWDESNEYYNNHQSLKVPYLGLKVPTKLITITYSDKTIESYE
jgi:hypothetical protein